MSNRLLLVLSSIDASLAMLGTRSGWFLVAALVLLYGILIWYATMPGADPCTHCAGSEPRHEEHCPFYEGD